MIPFISFIDLSAINELLRQTTKTFANKISLALLGNKPFWATRDFMAFAPPLKTSGG